MITKINQAQRIIDYINKYGSITSWQAYNDLGVMEVEPSVSSLLYDQPKKV